jgi:MHS family proline/betaine transporter-like MFS transporter
MKLNPIFLAIFATIVQYYDYALYGFSAVIISQTFFSDSTDITKLANTYLILALSILTKPLGSYIIAYIGDKYGRVYALRISSISIAIPTFIIGILPSFEQIGYVSTIILFISKMVIGAFASAELDGVRIYIFEKLDKKHSYLGNALVSSSTQIGAFFAILATFLTSGTSFWRVNFIIGGMLGLVIFILRHYLLESQEYILKKEEKTELGSLDMIVFIHSIIILGIIGAIYHFNFIFFGAFCFKILKITSEYNIYMNIMLMMLSYISCGIISSILCDRYNAHRLVIGSALFLSLIVSLVNIIFVANMEYINWVYILLAGMMPAYSVPLQIMIQRKVRVKFRYRFYSLAHGIGSGLISSTTPYIATKLYGYTNMAAAPQLYLCLLCLIAIIQFFSSRHMD